jgi:hypothetical protein
VFWKIAAWVIVVIAMLAFLGALAEMLASPAGSRRSRRAHDQIKYGIPLSWRFALLVLGGLWSFRFWRAGLVHVFGLPDVWSWVVAVVGFVGAVVLSGVTLALPDSTRWWVHLGMFAASVAVVGFFAWVVSRGGFVPMA